MVPAPVTAKDAMQRDCLRAPKRAAGRGGPGGRGVAAVLGALLLGAAMLPGGPARAAENNKTPKPWVQLKLDGLGFAGVSPLALQAGGSHLTVNFLDSSHMLLTFGLRTLVPRIQHEKDDAGEDDDRLVGAEIVELPAGKVTSHTEWHMHDHGRYLWALGGGRFLVRIGNQMFVMAPLANLGTADPFLRELIPSRALKPSLVFVSPDGKLVTLETIVAVPGQSKQTVEFGDMDTATVVAPKTRTVIDFFRVGEVVAREGKPAVVEVEKAGTVQSPLPLQLPTNGDGYLWSEDVGSGRWAVSFNPYAGKVAEMGAVMSSCRPRLQMVSRSEFVALGCRGSEDRLKLASYGLDGQETWEEAFGAVDAPAFAYAPVAGRFAFSYLSTGTVSGDVAVAGASSDRQEVRVYQNASGDMLLKVECTPAFKTGENFDLSEDGLLLATVQKGALAIYKLPGLTKKDEADIAEIAKFSPPVGAGPVTLARLTGPVAGNGRKRLPGVGAAGQDVPPGVAGVAPAVAAGVAAEVAPDEAAGTGDAPAEGAPVGTRTKPTLLKPGEKAEFKDKNAPKVQ